MHDDRKHFEMLILEGAQAGLNWETILKRREGYRKAFRNFDPRVVAAMSDQELEDLMHDVCIIRNRLKVFSSRKNARVFLEIQKEVGSFDAYVWRFVDGKPIVNRVIDIGDLQTASPQSDNLSKDLKKRGMSFVGSTIIHAYMQATGLINEHMADCFKANS